MEKFLPTDSEQSPALMNRLFEAAKAVLSDPALANNIASQLSVSSQQRTEEKKCSELWEDLMVKYCCVICQDVLACPTILGQCSHTFCFECIDSYLNSCISLNSGVDVEKTCPICRTEIKYQTFEALLHRDIESAVESIPDNDDRKSEWTARCNMYFETKRKLAGGKPLSQSSEENIEFKIAMAIAAAALVMIIVVRSSI